MKSASPGKRTSAAEVTQVSAAGLWIRVDDRELFASFEDFPWFLNGTIAQVTRVERPHPHHLHWPELDVDLTVDSLEHPDRYPRISRVPPASRSVVRDATAADKLARTPKRARARKRRE